MPIWIVGDISSMELLNSAVLVQLCYVQDTINTLSKYILIALIALQDTPCQYKQHNYACKIKATLYSKAAL